MKRIRNIALMAHVDAGKTTLTERILFETGSIRAMGSVDRGTAKTDNLSVERRRGISVRAVLTCTVYGDTTINIIDTPGHADFISQAERALLAVDGVVVLVSAVDGIQTNTEIILDTLTRLKLPALIFINKTDRDIADADGVSAELAEYLPTCAADVFERLAELDDECMEAFVENRRPDDETLKKKTSEYTTKGLLIPVLRGSAATGDGVKELLDAIVAYLPAPAETISDTAELCGTVYTVEHDKAFGRAAYVRMFSGSLAVRQSMDESGETKITMIKKPVSGSMEDSRELLTGEVGVIYGLSRAKTGDILGKRELLPNGRRLGQMSHALMMVSVVATDGTDILKLRAALEQLSAEEPLIDLLWEPVSKTLNIKVTGNIQTEILHDLIAERYGIEVAFGEPAVIYKETPSKHGFGFDAYTMPKPCWAVLRFELTPGERGSGVIYECTVPPSRLSYRYRKQVEESLRASLAQGPKGWEVTDMRLTLVDGEDHPIHTHPLDFTVATPLALADGLRNTGTTLLEPFIHAKFKADASHYGRLLNDIIKMRGEADTPVRKRDTIYLEASLPVSSSLDYPAQFASYTSGKGVMSAVFSEYRPCADELGRTAQRRGIDPLNRSAYILAARHAMSGTVFEVN